MRILTNKLGILFILALLIVGLAPNAFAWTYLRGYKNAYNITVPNWNYSVIYGSNTIKAQVGYALFNLTNITNPLTIQVEGYAQNGKDLGKIPTYLIAQSGYGVIVAIRNTTEQCSGLFGHVCDVWTNATIFYNPTMSVNLLNSSISNLNCGLYNCTSSYNGIKFNIPIPNLILSNVANNDGLIGTSTNTITKLSGVVDFLPPYINYNFTNLIILSNKSLASISFNLSYNLADYQLFTENNNANSDYILAQQGICNLISSTNFVENAPVISYSSNYVYNTLYNNFDGLGFDSYIALNLNNTIISEGMVFNQNIGYNSVYGAKQASSCLDIQPFGIPQTLNFDVQSTKGSVLFTILPAFTTNVILKPIIPNPNLAGINLTTTFQYKTYIYGINWTYNFTTYAYPENIGNRHSIIFNQSNVSYLFLNITHDVQKFGNNCQNIYLDSNALYPKVDPIPYYLYKYNASICSLVISNKSYGQYVFNSLWLYSDPYYSIPTQSNAIIDNEWQFASGSSNSYRISDSNVPYTISLTNELNTLSFITVGTFSTNNHAYIGNDGHYYETINDAGLGLGSVTVTDFLGAFPRQFLISAIAMGTNRGGSNGEKSAFSLNLGMFDNQSSTTVIANTITLGFKHDGILEIGPSTFVNVSLTNDGSFTVQRLTTAQFIKGQTYVINNTSGYTGCTFTYNCTLAVNSSINLNINKTSSSHINYNTTTIVLPTAMVTLYTGIQLPKFAAIILALIVLIICFMMLSTEKTWGGLPLMLGLTLLFILGLWQFPFIVLVIIICLIFIIYEFIKHEKIK